MEATLVLLKPSCVQRQLIGEIVNRFERCGLRISGMKMVQLCDALFDYTSNDFAYAYGEGECQ